MGPLSTLPPFARLIAFNARFCISASVIRYLDLRAVGQRRGYKSYGISWESRGACCCACRCPAELQEGGLKRLHKLARIHDKLLLLAYEILKCAAGRPTI